MTKYSREEIHNQLAGGVIMDVTNPEQAKIAECGCCCCNGT